MSGGNGLWLMSSVSGGDKLPNNSGYIADVQASVEVMVWIEDFSSEVTKTNPGNRLRPEATADLERPAG